MATLLTDAQTTALKGAPLTYQGVGGTLSDESPSGYESFTRSVTLSDTTFDEAVERLMNWRVHERAGLRVSASALRIAEGEVVLMRLGIGAASLRIPCRVIYAVAGPDAAGFAYGTLPGHPELGEEFFFLERDGDQVRFMVRAFSRPSSKLAHLAGPIGRRLQQVMTTRYLAAANGPSTDRGA